MRSDGEVDSSAEFRSDRRCNSSADTSASSGQFIERSSKRKRSCDNAATSRREGRTPSGDRDEAASSRRKGRTSSGDGRLADAGDSTDPDDGEGLREVVRDILREFPGLPEELARQLQGSRKPKEIGDGQSGSGLQYKAKAEEGGVHMRRPRATRRDAGDISDYKHLESRVISDAIPEPTPFRESPSFVAVVDDVRKRISMDLKEMLTEHQESKFAERMREQRKLRNLTMESAFCDIDGGDSESRKARNVAVGASKCVVSMSSFSGERRRRVCSGFVIESDSSSKTYKILSAATLIRSLRKHNAVDLDLRVTVCLPSGAITDALISMIDLHYNLLVLEVKSDEKLNVGVLVQDVLTEGVVLAMGRFYDDGSLMCAKGNIITQSTDCDCSELSLSSCQTTMAGVGGPLVNYSGHILGINFYGLKNTPFLSMAVVVKCLEQWKRHGQIARPCIGFSYTSIGAVPLKALEKCPCPYADNGLFVSKVVKGSFADLAGLSVGDVIIKCEGNDLSNAPEFGALLLDICTKQMQPDLRKITLELIVVKQKDGNTIKITFDAGALGESDYNRWPVPGPNYGHQNIGRENFMRLL